MFILGSFILVTALLLSLVGLGALLLGARFIRNRQRLVQSTLVDTRTKLKQARIKKKHTKDFRTEAEFDESLLFALASGYDDLTIGLNKIENARNHIANRRKGNHL